MKGWQAKAFTLIEMLTVIAIIAIIFTISIPAITNLMKSGGLNAASREVSNTLSLARQLAITRRVYARVVFPYSLSPLTHQDMLYRSYAVMTNRDHTPAVAPNWRYASKWEYLPIGAVFMNVSALLGSPPCLDNLSAEVVVFPTNTNASLALNNSGNLAYVEFSPTGAAVNSGTFTITEGFASGGTPSPTSKTTTSLVNSTIISVDNLVGRIQVARP